MSRWTSFAAFAVAAFALVAAPVVAFAEAQDVVSRLRASRQAERYDYAVPGQSVRAGGGRILVNAPLATVRGVVTDYGNYQDFMPKFKRSRIVGKTAKHTDVYFQVPILRGTANVWTLTRFHAPRREADGSEVIEGTMLQGNVREFRAKWMLVPVDDNHTVLKSELLIIPKLPLPGSLVTTELAYAAGKAVTALRDRAESMGTQVASGGPTTP